MAKGGSRPGPGRTTGARAEGGLTQRQEACYLAFVELGNASEAAGALLIHSANRNGP
jgi:hypothetical protein